MKSLARVALVVVTLLFLPAIAWGESFGGRVLSVTDGDTLEIERGGETITVRLHGIDAPESDQPYGEQAKRFASRLATRTRVTVEVLDTDRYGRKVGRVTLPDGTALNHALVRAGYAWWYEYYAPDNRVLETLQEQAKQNNSGLWSAANPIAPWDWRNGVRPRDSEREQGGEPSTEDFPYDPDGDRDGEACERLP